MTKHAHELQDTPRAVAPIGRSGRARLTLNTEDVVRAVGGALRAAAAPSAITDDRVRGFCAATERPHWRFERVLLREAFNVVEPDDLIERMLFELRRRLEDPDGGIGVEAPLDKIIGFVGSGAMERFLDDLPRRLAGLLEESTEPAFVDVERLLRFGRLTHKTRVYLLYWQRLRDYLIWSVRRGAV